MDDMKQWYLSKTMWGALIAMAAALLQVAGFDIDPVTQGDFADSIVALSGAVGALVAIYGRLTAEKRLG